MRPDQLKNVRCEKCGDEAKPDCEGVFMKARCHPESATKVFYVAQMHSLRIICATCDKRIAEIEFDGKPHDPRSASFMNHLHDGELADRLEKAVIALDGMPNDSRVPANVRAKMCAEVRHARELMSDVATHLIEAVHLEGIERTSS